MWWSGRVRSFGVVASASAAVMLAAVMPAQADDGMFESWSTVTDDVLEDERGRNIVVDQSGITIEEAGAAVAVNVGFQYVENTITGDAYGGSINLTQGAIDNQNMVINAFNAGNNVTMMNQLSIVVDMTTPGP